MNQGFDLEKSLRILKSKRITKEKVAKVTNVTPGYISKMLSGAKPISQNFIDIFLKEFGNELEGVVLIEATDSHLVTRILALESTVEVLKKINIGLVKSLGEISSTYSGKPLKHFIDKDTAKLITEFDEAVEDDVKRRLPKQ